MNFRFFDIGLREIINEPGNEHSPLRTVVMSLNFTALWSRHRYINASADSSQSQG